MNAADDAATSRPRLEIVSDLVCPWCYIGKHRLAQALEKLAGTIDLDVTWRPFELNPTLPAAGMDRRAYCETKFGSLERANQLYANIAANARADGLPMSVERITRTPNTRAAHRLIDLAGRHGCQNAVVDRLFSAYFVDGEDIGDRATLVSIGTAAGLDTADVEHALDDHTADADIEARERAMSELGVHGVPAFVYNGRLLSSGAQSPETIALAIKRAHEKGL